MVHALLGSVEPIIISADDTQTQIRRLIGQGWDRPGQSIDSRPLVAWLITDKIDRVTHCLLGIDGTPWRGLVLVPIDDTDNPALRAGPHPSVYSRRDTRILQTWVCHMLARETGR